MTTQHSPPPGAAGFGYGASNPEATVPPPGSSQQERFGEGHDNNANTDPPPGAGSSRHNVKREPNDQQEQVDPNEFMRAFFQNFQNSSFRTQSSESSSQQERDRKAQNDEQVKNDTKRLLHDYFNRKYSGGVDPDLSFEGYSFGNVPVNFEADLRSNAFSKIGQALESITFALDGDFGNSEHNLTNRHLILDGIRAAKTCGVHFQKVSDELRRTHNPPTLARKPKIGYNDEHPNFKVGFFPKYSGSSDEDTLSFVNWIEQIFSFLEGRTARVHVDVLTKHATGAALATISQWRNEKKDNIGEIVAMLEQNVAGVVSPAIAKNHLNRLTIKPGETINSISSVIYTYAMMVHINDDEQFKQSNMSETAKSCLLRIIPTDLLTQYNNFVRNSRMSGKLDMSYKETVKHLISLNQENVDVKENHKFAMKTAAANQVREVYYVQGNRRPQPKRYGRPRHNLVEKQRFVDRDPKMAQDHVVYNVEYAEGPESASDEESKSEDEQSSDDDSEPESTPSPEEQDVFEVRKSYKLDPKAYGVTNGECFKCGLSGHRYKGPTATQCPLFKVKFHPKKCGGCGRGAHKMSVCPQRKN